MGGGGKLSQNRSLYPPVRCFFLNFLNTCNADILYEIIYLSILKLDKIILKVKNTYWVYLIQNRYTQF